MHKFLLTQDKEGKKGSESPLVASIQNRSCGIRSIQSASYRSSGDQPPFSRSIGSVWMDGCDGCCRDPTPKAKALAAAAATAFTFC